MSYNPCVIIVQYKLVSFKLFLICNPEGIVLIKIKYFVLVSGNLITKQDMYSFQTKIIIAALVLTVICLSSLIQESDCATSRRRIHPSELFSYRPIKIHKDKGRVHVELKMPKIFQGFAKRAQTALSRFMSKYIPNAKH